MDLNIYCDGGARGNPGPGASAFLVADSSGRTLHQSGIYLGHVTNNQAEYQAVTEALRWLSSSPHKSHLTSLNFFLDSQLVVNQLKGLWKIKDPQLKEKHREIKKLIENLPATTYNFTYIPRSQNSRTDYLVNLILDKHSH